MGVVGTCFKLVFFVIVPLLVLAVAAFIGYCASTPNPWGTAFVNIFLVQGTLTGTMKYTPEVPSDIVLMPRPANELFATLPSGHKLPMSGIGMCCRPNAYHHPSVRNQVLWYLAQGGRHIDGADVYLNHEAIGQGIQDAIKLGVPRSEIFVTTKVWPDQFGTEETTKAVQRFLKELQLDYIDMILLHMPRRNLGLFGTGPNEFADLGCESATVCRQQTWLALTAARKQGLVKEIGISNFRLSHIKELQELEGGAPIAVNQLQFHPWHDDAMMELTQYCRDNNIHIVGYNSLGGSFEKDKAFSQAALKAIADAHNTSVSQVLLRWSIQSGASVIPGTGNPKHMLQNLGVYSFELSPAEMSTMAQLRKDALVTAMPSYFNPE